MGFEVIFKEMKEKVKSSIVLLFKGCCVRKRGFVKILVGGGFFRDQDWSTFS